MKFHCHGSNGDWLNDPNGLVCHQGRFYLFAQHRADGPHFQAVSWARYSSSDLLHWQDDGVVIATQPHADVFSGSVIAVNGDLQAWYTVHGHGVQHQVSRISHDVGKTWSPVGASLGPPLANWRDPFVFFYPPTQDWRMIVAQPCDWARWHEDPSSILKVYRGDATRMQWHEVGQVGPWMAHGVMWEVPALVFEPGSTQRCWLFVSTLDRKGGRSDGAVHRYRGIFDGNTFVRDDPADEMGELLDYGPDYYALIPNLAHGWPDEECVVVAWASSWQIARHFPWRGFAGGPIALPRKLTARGSVPLPRIMQAFSLESSQVPLAGRGMATFEAANFTLIVSGEDRALTVRAHHGLLEVTRTAQSDAGPFDWSGVHAFESAAGPITLVLFVDGSLIELFIAPHERWVTCLLPHQDKPFDVQLHAGGQLLALHWTVIA
jgi:fructan beta-fructosidase